MSKKTKSQQGKKKQTRNILIGVAVALVIAVAIFLIVALQPDAAGMNCFQRKATVASADGQKISMGEFRVGFAQTSQQYASIYSQLGITPDEASIKSLQESTARDLLLQKIYIKEAKALGITLSKEEQDTCKKNAQDAINELDKYIKESMIANGSYSKSAFDRQIVDYYSNLGMNKNEYQKYLQMNGEASLYAEKLLAYWTEKNTPDDETLVQYYRENAEASMYVENQEGEKEAAYTDGQLWTSYEQFRNGQAVPLPYVPEGFIFIDYVRLEAASMEEAEAIITKINSDEITFDALKASAEENKDPFREKLNGPYPIAENDHQQLFADQEIYTKAASLAVGEMGTFFTQNTPEGDKVDTTVTIHLFRRAEGDIFMDGDSRVVKIDYFTGLRETVQNEYVSGKWNEIQNGWLKDIKFEKALYTYKGALG